MVKGDEKLQQQNPTEPKLIMSGTMKLPTHTIKTILDETKIKNKLRVVMNVSDIIEATASGGGSGAGMMTSSPVGNDSNITLWQFLLELLTSEKHQDIIQWTKCREGEFKLIDAEAVAKLWGQRKAKPHMNYDKLSRALRYYYEKNIIKKVIGQKFVYRFVTPNFNENSTTANSGVEYPVIKPTKIEFKEEKDYETGRFGTTSSRTNFSALSLVNTSSPPSTAHSVATPSPSNSACSPSSSISSSTASLMAGAAHSNSPLPSTSSPNGSSASGAEESPSTNSSGKLTTNRKRSHSPKCSTTSTTATTSSTTTTPSARRSKPNPLNLTAATNFGMQHHPSQTSAGFTAAVAAAAAAAQFSPMMMLHQNSPLLQPALNQLCAIASVASLASAGMYGPQMSPLLAAATSPFRSTLGSTPKGDGTIKTPSTQPQIFQFPPTSAAFSTTSLFNPFSSLISPGAPFMMSSPASNTFKFPSTESLKTPTVPMKMPSL